MRSRGIRWRNRAYDYLKENGPATSSELLLSVKNGEGRTFIRGAPRNASHVFQVMRVDRRFNRKKVQVRGTTNSYEVVEWRLADEE